MKIRVFLSFILWIGAVSLQAASIDTLLVKSPSMEKDVEVVVISPDRPHTAVPVIYLLHGYGGNAHSWLKIKPELPRIADRDGLIFVCPDGENSWYWDSPVNLESRYETFVSKELVAFIDGHYSTLRHRTGRAVTGLSMGGQGALWNAIRHKEIFGAAGSMSGGVDIRPFPENWEMKKLLGEYKDNHKRWDEYTVINCVDKIKSGELALIIDCGYDDFFFQVNNNLHQKLLERKIKHDFLVRPGEHNSHYWNNAVDYQILFFRKYFEQARQSISR